MRTAAWVACIAVAAVAVWWLANLERGRGETERRDRRATGPAETGSEPRGPAGLKGRVVEAGSGEPIAGARVQIHAAPPVPEHVMRLAFPAPLADAVTGVDGTFRFGDLPPDAHTIVRASAEGWLPAHTQCPGDAAHVQLALQRGQEKMVRVVDREGRALADAVGIVYAPDAAWPRAVVAAEPDGSLALCVAPGDRLLARAPGYATASMRSPRPLVVLGPEFRIAGRVVTEADEPLAGVTVVLDLSFRPKEATRTDEEGRFAFGGLRYQSCRLTAEAEGLKRHHHRVTPGDENVRVVLTRPHEVSGTVVFPDGTPAAGATVNGFPVDDRGSFVVEGLPSVLSRLDARYGELPAGPDEEPSPPAFAAWIEVTPPVRDVRLVLEPKHRSFARIRLRDADGEPAGIYYVPGARVDGEEGGTALLTLTTPPRLARTIHVMTENPFTLDVEATVRTWPTAEEALAEEISFPDPPEATLVVRAPDGSVLPRGLEASVEFPDCGTRRERCAWVHERAAPDRLTFRFDPARASGERFTLHVSAPGYPTRLVDLPPPRPGDVLVARLARPAAIVGRALGPDGKPLWRGRVSVWVRGALDYPDTETFGLDGSFRVAPLHGGEAVIKIELDRDAGPPLAMLERTLAPGSVLDLGTVRLQPLRTVAGHVVDARGRPLGGVMLRRYDDWEWAPVATARNGRFRLEVPAYARSVIIASKPHHATVGVALDEAATIRLPTPGRARLVLRAPPPELAQGYEDENHDWYVHARRPGADWSWQPNREDVERAPGRWVRVFRDLPPGPLEFFVCTKDGEESVEVAVAPGTTVTAELVVP